MACSLQLPTAGTVPRLQTTDLGVRQTWGSKPDQTPRLQPSSASRETNLLRTHSAVVPRTWRLKRFLAGATQHLFQPRNHSSGRQICDGVWNMQILAGCKSNGRRDTMRASRSIQTSRPRHAGKLYVRILTRQLRPQPHRRKMVQDAEADRMPGHCGNARLAVL